MFEIILESKVILHLLKKIVVLFLIIILTINIYATGESGAQFLKMGIGARATAMGRAFTGISNDATAVYWNPAGISQINNFNMSAMQHFWLLDMNYQNLSAVLPTEYGSFGVSISNSSSGEIPKYENFERIGTYKANDMALSFVYAKNIMSSISLGISGKYIQQTIDKEVAKGYAVDLGAYYNCKKIKGLQLGAAIQNIGPDIKFIEEGDPLPLTFRAGLGYERGPILLACDITRPRFNDLIVNLGTEVSPIEIVTHFISIGELKTLKDVLFLRTGYNRINGGSIGIGIKWHDMGLDYAYNPFKDIDTGHVFSFNLGL